MYLINMLHAFSLMGKKSMNSLLHTVTDFFSNGIVTASVVVGDTSATSRSSNCNEIRAKPFPAEFNRARTKGWRQNLKCFYF